MKINYLLIKSKGEKLNTMPLILYTVSVIDVTSQGKWVLRVCDKRERHVLSHYMTHVPSMSKEHF